MHSVSEGGKLIDHFGGSTQREQTDTRNLTRGPGGDRQSGRRSGEKGQEVAPSHRIRQKESLLTTVNYSRLEPCNE
jgi:hypothetical protein